MRYITTAKSPQRATGGNTIIVICRQMFAHTDISNDNDISEYYAQLRVRWRPCSDYTCPPWVPTALS